MPRSEKVQMRSGKVGRGRDKSCQVVTRSEKSGYGREQLRQDRDEVRNVGMRSAKVAISSGKVRE